MLTAPKTNMEPENGLPLEKEMPFGKSSFSGSMLIFWVVYRSRLFPWPAWGKSKKTWLNLMGSFRKDESTNTVCARFRRCGEVDPRNLTARPWKMMVGRWVSSWDCLFLGAMLNFQGVDQFWTERTWKWSCHWKSFHGSSSQQVIQKNH